MKRVFALFVAVVLILPLCGCSGGEPLTKQEYADSIYYRISKYFWLENQVGLAYHEYKTKGTPIDMAKLREQAQDVETLVIGIKYLTPPSDYKEHHDKFCDGMRYEKVYFKQLDKAFLAENMDEFEKSLNKAWEKHEKCTLFDAWIEFLPVTLKDGVEYDDI